MTTRNFQEAFSRLQEQQVIRASLFNLIVVTEESARKEYVKTITTHVTKRFPCRVLFITITHSSPDIQVEVSTLPETENTFCDQISIQTPPSLLEKIPFLLLPHFLTDLPIYLLWAERPDSHPLLLKQLQEWSSRLIYDSELSPNLLDFCQILEKQSKTKEVVDLSWARTESWRELIAATFYSPSRLSSLQTAKSVEICYSTATNPFFCHTTIQATYLSAWLTASLKWNPKVSFIPKQDLRLPPGGIISIDIVCQDLYHYTFHRDPDHLEQIRILVCDEEKCEIPSKFVFSKVQSGLSLVNLIYHPERSP